MTSSLVSIVDDDAAICASLADLLRAAGYQADTFASGRAFLLSGAAERSQCVVADIQMAGLSGLDLMAQLTARGSTVPVIIMTARSEDHWAARAIDGGAAGFLRKPFEAAALLDCIERSLTA